MSLSRTSLSPRVLFVESDTWEAFLALAAVLRRNHVAVDHVALANPHPRGRALRLVESLVFGRSRLLIRRNGHGSYAWQGDGAEQILLPDTVDAHVHDDIVELVATDDGGPLDPHSRVAPGIDPRVLIDKLVVSAVCRTCGVPVPEESDTPDWVDFPVVVKSRVGSGGKGVRIAHDRDSMLAAWEELELLYGTTPFLQRYYPDLISSGGVAHEGRLLAGGVYSPAPAPSDPTGTPRAIVLVDNPDVMALTSAFVEAIGFTGFFSIGWVMDADGNPHLIDFNPRAFGSWPAMQARGVDMVGSYLRLIGVQDGPSSAQPQYGISAGLLVFPGPPGMTLRALRYWARDGLRTVRQGTPTMGSRWATVSVTKVAMWTARETARLALRRRS